MSAYRISAEIELPEVPHAMETAARIAGAIARGFGEAGTVRVTVDQIVRTDAVSA